MPVTAVESLILSPPISLAKAWTSASLPCMQRQISVSATFMHARYVANISYTAASAATRINDSSVIGAGVRYLDGGAIDRTDINGAPVRTVEGGGMQFSFDMPLREARDLFERAYFEYHLQREGGSMTRVAEKTGLERTHLYRKLKQLGVDLGRKKNLLGT